MLRLSLALTAALTVVGIDPADALGANAKLSSDGTKLVVDSDVSEKNNLVIRLENGEYLVADAGGREVDAGRDCREVGHTARCEGGFSRIVADLKSEDDRLDVQVQKATTVDGGSGNDAILTGDKNDDIDGNLGADTIVGRGGDDEVHGSPSNDSVNGGLGNDKIEGGAGDDTLFGDDGDDKMTGGGFGVLEVTVGGNDTLDAGDGQDSFSSDPGSDDYHGGPGAPDFIGYGGLRVDVTLDDFPNDGPSGDFDNVHADVENFSGGALGDTLTGSPGKNTIFGGAGNDNIDGRGGQDFLNGDFGDDVIVAREDPPTPFKDIVDCGEDTDRAFLDLTDELDFSPGCETVERAPVGQGPNVRIARSKIKTNRSGRVRIPLSCPRAQPNGCKGTLALRGSRGTSAFSLSPGKKTVVRRRLARKHRRRLRQHRRGIRLKATAREHDPFGRPKTTSTIFRLRLRSSR
jgi:Ca2+-binding RTX toxin-like protein